MANKLGLPDALNMGEGNLIIGVAKNKAETVMVSSSEFVGGAKVTNVGGGHQLTVGGVKNESVGMGSFEEVGFNKTTVVGRAYEIAVGDSAVTILEDGTIKLTGKNIVIEGSESVAIKGGRIDLN
jgi:type VI secretion system secreted protein VgrG